MLVMKTMCERCRTFIDNASAATICSYECALCITCSAAMDNECLNCGGELTARTARVGQARVIRRGWAGRIGSYHAQRKPSGAPCPHAPDSVQTGTVQQRGCGSEASRAGSVGEPRSGLGSVHFCTPVL